MTNKPYGSARERDALIAVARAANEYGITQNDGNLRLLVQALDSLPPSVREAVFLPKRKKVCVAYSKY